MDDWYWVEMVVDYGIPVVIAALGWWMIVLGWRTYRKVPARHCPECGYDMRETAGLICPECGKSGGTQERIEHGFVRWKLVWLGRVMFVPLVWALVFTAIAGSTKSYTWWTIWQATGVYRDGVGNRVSVVATEGGWNTHEESVRENRLGFEALWQMRMWMDPTFRGVANGSQRTWETADERRRYLESTVSYDVWTAGLGPESRFDINSPIMLTRARFMVHAWVYPVLHHGRYFWRHGDVNMFYVWGGREGQASSEGEPVEMPRETLGRMSRATQMARMNFIGVTCDDRVMEMIKEHDGLVSLRMGHVSASPRAIQDALAGKDDLTELTIELDRPLTDADLAGLVGWMSPPGFSKYRHVELSWRGEGEAKDESLAAVYAAFDQSKGTRSLQMKGILRPDDYAKTVLVRKTSKTEETFKADEGLTLIYEKGMAAEDAKVLGKLGAKVVER